MVTSEGYLNNEKNHVRGISELCAGGTSTGVRQSDVLSPLFINNILDFILWKNDMIECGIE